VVSEQEHRPLATADFPSLFATRAELLSVALLVVEFVAGIQTYVTSTVTPLAADVPLVALFVGWSGAGAGMGL
jgi:hypothetical protein